MRFQDLGLMLMLLSCAGESSAQQPAEAVAVSHHLMPTPAGVKFLPGRLVVDRSFSVAVKGYRDQRLERGIDRAMRRLELRTGFDLPRQLAADAAGARLLIECAGAGRPVPSLGEDESYALEVTASRVALRARTVIGALRGLETLLQLLDSDGQGYYLPQVMIEDRPRFPWRGLMLDSARHFQPLEVIRRNLDGMAAVKLNVLHWHLTDDQGFRVESKKYPKLHQLGSDGLFYTQEQIREVIAYARERGIRLVPEFDMPGHATSWLVGHPELGSAPGPYQIERQAGIFEPVLDPSREAVYQFLDGLLGEMAGLFPDEYFHIGGDENEGHQWDRNPEIQAFMKRQGIKDNHSLQAYFTLRVARLVQKHGKKMMGWEEILHPDLPRDVVVHSWRGPEALAEAAKQGHLGILSAGYYLDLMYPARQHYAVDPVAEGSGLSDEQAARILGGEAAMWGEYVSPETIDSRIWPRLAAIAERLWSPRAATEVDDMYRRLAVLSVQLEELGLTHERNQKVILRRLAGGPETGPLETLVSTLEPVKQYNRGKQHPTTMLSPLSSLVDAARADSPAARRLAALTDGLLGDAPRFLTGREELQRLFSGWQRVRPEIGPLLARSAGLRGAGPLADGLAEIARLGLEAVASLSAPAAPPEGWKESSLKLLAQASRPRDALEFAVVPSVRELIIAAAERARLGSESAAEWRRRVQRVAAEMNHGGHGTKP